MQPQEAIAFYTIHWAVSLSEIKCGGIGPRGKLHPDGHTGLPIYNMRGRLRVAHAVQRSEPSKQNIRAQKLGGSVKKVPSYGHDPADQFRQAAVYIDRILRGEKPSELPVQAPEQI